MNIELIDEMFQVFRVNVTLLNDMAQMGFFLDVLWIGHSSGIHIGDTDFGNCHVSICVYYLFHDSLAPHSLVIPYWAEGGILYAIHHSSFHSL